jgi:hypothetical protein
MFRAKEQALRPPPTGLYLLATRSNLRSGYAKGPAWHELYGSTSTAFRLAPWLHLRRNTDMGSTSTVSTSNAARHEDYFGVRRKKVWPVTYLVASESR